MQNRTLDVNTRNALGEFLLALLPTPEDRISTAMFLISEAREVCDMDLDEIIEMIRSCIEAMDKFREEEEDD